VGVVEGVVIGVIVGVVDNGVNEEVVVCVDELPLSVDEWSIVVVSVGIGIGQLLLLLS